MQIVSRVHTLVLCSLPTLNLWMVKEGRTGQGSQASVSRKIFNSSSRALGKWEQRTKNRKQWHQFKRGHISLHCLIFTCGSFGSIWDSAASWSPAGCLNPLHRTQPQRRSNYAWYNKPMTYTSYLTPKLLRTAKSDKLRVWGHLCHIVIPTSTG